MVLQGSWEETIGSWMFLETTSGEDAGRSAAGASGPDRAAAGARNADGGRGAGAGNSGGDARGGAADGGGGMQGRGGRDGGGEGHAAAPTARLVGITEVRLRMERPLGAPGLPAYAQGATSAG